jgi:hypothetical protein
MAVTIRPCVVFVVGMSPGTVGAFDLGCCEAVATQDVDLLGDGF